MMTMLPRDMLLNVSTYVGGTSFVSLCVSSKGWNHLLQHSARNEKEQVAHRKERVGRLRAQFEDLALLIRIPVKYRTEELIDPDATFYPVRLDPAPELPSDFYVSEMSVLNDEQIAQVQAKCTDLGLVLHVRFESSGSSFVEFGGAAFHAAIAAREAALCARGPRFLRLFRQHQQLVVAGLPRLKLPEHLYCLYCANYTREPGLNRHAIEQVKNFSVSALRQAVAQIVSLEAEISALDVGFDWSCYGGGGGGGGATYRPWKSTFSGRSCSPPLDVDLYVREVCEKVRELVMRSHRILEEQRRFAHAQVAELQCEYDEGVARSTTPRLRAILQRDVTDHLDKARVFAEQTELLVEFDAELRKLWKTELRPIAGPPPPSFGLRRPAPFVTTALVVARPTKRARVMNV